MWQDNFRLIPEPLFTWTTRNMDEVLQTVLVYYITLILRWKNAEALQTLYKHYNKLETMGMMPQISTILVWFEGLQGIWWRHFSWQTIHCTNSDTMLVNVLCHISVTSHLEHSRLRNDLYCVGWGVKLYSLTPRSILISFKLIISAFNRQAPW